MGVKMKLPAGVRELMFNWADLRRFLVLFAATSHFLISACSVVALIVLLGSSSSTDAVSSRCLGWAEPILGDFIRSNHHGALSFRLVLVTLTLVAMMGAVSSGLLLRGLTKKCRIDLIPWLVSNGTIVPVTIALLMQQTAMDYIYNKEPKWECLLYFTIYWAINALCLTLVATEYSYMPPYFSKENLYRKNINCVNQGVKMSTINIVRMPL